MTTLADLQNVRDNSHEAFQLLAIVRRKCDPYDPDMQNLTDKLAEVVGAMDAIVFAESLGRKVTVTV